MIQVKLFNPVFVLLLALLFAPRIVFCQDYATVGAEDDTAEIETNLLVEAQVLFNSKPFEGVIIQVINETEKVVKTDTTEPNGFFRIKLDFDSVLKPVARFRYSETAQIFIVDREYRKEVKKRFKEKDQEPEIINF